MKFNYEDDDNENSVFKEKLGETLTNFNVSLKICFEQMGENKRKKQKKHFINIFFSKKMKL